MSTRGRPSKYKPEYAEQAKRLCALGATDVELGEAFDVRPQTIWYWACHYPEFSEALKAGKAAADERVEHSLYHKAVGYTYDAVKIFNNQGEPLVVPYREHVAPDTTACIFWLKNRRPDLWRDKRELEATGKGDERLLEYSEEELIARLMAKRQEAQKRGN